MPRKIYRLKLFPQTTYNVTLGSGRIYPVQFGNATLSGAYKKNGFFMTEDEELQAALESDTQLNKLYYLEKTIGQERPARSLAPAETKKEQKSKGEEAGANPAAVTSFVEALQYLHKHYGVATDNIASMPLIMAKAEELGVEFVNWKPKQENEKAVEPQPAIGIAPPLESPTPTPAPTGMDSLAGGEQGTAEGADEEKPSTAGITNYTAAKEYLRKYYSAPINEMQNAAATSAMAEKLGVEFTDWKK